MEAKKDIAKIISEKFPSFSKGQKRIAEAIMNNYDKAAYMTAAKLGELCHVSESTVVRFANELGYDGYPEMQHAIQELVRTKLTPNQRIAITEMRIGNSDLLDAVLNADRERIKFTLEHTDREAFNQAVDTLLAAKNIYIFGARSSSTLAYFLNFNLELIFDNVKLIRSSSSSEVFEQILPIDKGDVLFAISFPRYSKKILNAVNYAKGEGAEVIALTDSPLSPLCEHANCVLTAQSDMASFVDSLVAPMSILNAILVALTQRRRQAIAARFDKLERLWDEYDVYEKH